MSKLTMSKRIRIYLLAAGLVLACGSLLAQSAAHQPSGDLPSSEVGTRANPLPSPQVSPTVAAAAAEKPAENAAEEEENAQFKYSSIVRGLAHKTGLSKETVYWIFNVINFAILAGGLIWIVRKAMPHGFAPRTTEIQRAIEEARKASADAAVRLGEIESRLGRLDSEIEEIRRAAEADFSAEEQRIKSDAERDAKNVITSAEQEIAAATRSAQRELKAFAAGLAIDLAEKKIKVDEATDHALVRNFAAQLGAPGKDGQ